MKHIILTLLILTIAASGLSALRPKVDYQKYYMEVTDVERQDSCLQVSVILKHLPGYWVIIPQERTFLRSHNDTIGQYGLIGAENIELDKRIWMKESGQREATLIFEKIPSDVNAVDMILIDINGQKEIMALGIDLEEKDTVSLPTMIDPTMLFGNASPDEWKGLDPSRYKDIPHYAERGKAHVKGRLYDYHPAAGYSALKMYATNFITGSRDVQTENINPDGTFAFDLNVDYPQYCRLEIGDMPSKDVFVIPGDTVELVTTTQADFLNPKDGYRKYFGYTGRINDATAINLLTDSLRSRYGLDRLFTQYGLEKTDTLAETVLTKNKEIGAVLNKILTDLPEFLGNLPVSAYVKDLLATKALTSVASIMLWNGMRSNLNIEETVYEPLGDAKQFIFCNPLTISTDDNLNYSLTQSRYSRGLENCFASQLQSAKSLIETIEIGTLHNKESLNKTRQSVAELTSLIEYPALNMALLKVFTDMTEDVVLEENSIKAHTEYTRLDLDKNADVLEELIRPYLGTLIYIDFWALWCPPCRMGMIDQKKIIEHFADQPFKVLYVSDDSNIPGSNQWLEKNSIQGEHIYLSRENWRRISEYFNFNSIPFGVLIGKDGNLIKIHFNLDHPNAEKEIERHLQQ